MLPPDSECDGGVTDGNDDGGDDEDGEWHQAHVHLPLPRLLEIYPALCPILLCLTQIEEEQDGNWEHDTC